MIQFLRYHPDYYTKTEMSILTGTPLAKFFFKRIFYLFAFIYSTLFLAVALPFVSTPFMPIYFVGGMVVFIYIMRLGNHIIKFFKYQNGKIVLNDEEIEVYTKKEVYKIPLKDLTYLEVNIFGNLLIREKYTTTPFPLALIDEEDRNRLKSLFQDMAPKRTKFYMKIWEFVDAITVALVLAVHIIQYIVQAYYIPTGSMEDTLLVGDHLFVEKITYGPTIPQMIGMDSPVHLTSLAIREVQKGDIVIFKPPHETDKDYIKRCIAVPGDKFNLINGQVYINDVKQVEPYVKDNYTAYSGIECNKKDELEGIVPEGKVIVLGDNRTNSKDSRCFGLLEISRIKGKALLLYWNTEQVFNLDFSRFGLIK